MRASVTPRTPPPPHSSDSPGRQAEEYLVERVIRRSILALALLPLSLAGCETKEVWLEVPGFAAVDGIWFWRLSEATDTYQRMCRILLADPVVANGQETLSYVQECDSGDAGMPLSAELQHDSSHPGAVRLGLWYARSDAEGPGLYRVSSYGPHGESALSTTPFQL